MTTTTKARFLLKGTFLISLWCFISACSGPGPSQQDPALFQEGDRHIILMHPTVTNLKTFLFLTGEGIFPLPEGYRVIGLYNQDGRYDYAQSLAFIHEEGLDHVALLGLEPAADTQQLYGENPWSETFRELFSRSQGAIFFGGPDIPPALYGEETDLLTVISDPARHHLELSFLFHLLGGTQDTSFVPLMESRPHYRILGLCLGMQSMNVATGGSLVQDIPTTLYGLGSVEQVLALDTDQQHRNYHTHYAAETEISSYLPHRIRILPGSQLWSLTGDEGVQPAVMSSHHQAADALGRGFVVTARSVDGAIVEAIEHSRYPHVIGVQFHPELPAIFQPETGMRLLPGEAPGPPYREQFPGRQGTEFHLNFWRHIGLMYP